MKKILFLGLLLLVSVNIIYAEYNDDDTTIGRQMNLEELTDEAITFFGKVSMCAPAKLESSNWSDRVIGKVKGGCRYITTLKTNMGFVTYDCTLPMPVAVGYSTTFLDAIDYRKEGLQELSEERLKQGLEISRLMLDYCKKK